MTLFLQNLFSVSLMGLLLYYLWEAMLVSYLSTRIISLPFRDVRSLLSTDFKLIALPGSYQADAFRFSNDPFWQKAWNERMKPYFGYTDEYGTRNHDLHMFMLDNEDVAVYSIFHANAAQPEYKSCRMIVIPGNYDYKPYTYGFQKDSPYLLLFNHFMNEMKEKGTMDQIMTKYEIKPQICPDYSGQPLGISTCVSAFIMLAFGMATCMIVVFLEMLGRRFYPEYMEKILIFLNGKSKEDIVLLD